MTDRSVSGDDEALHQLGSELSVLLERHNQRQLSAFGAKQDEVMALTKQIREHQLRFCISQIEGDIAPGTETELDDVSVDGKSAAASFDKVDKFLGAREAAAHNFASDLQQLAAEVYVTVSCVR